MALFLCPLLQVGIGRYIGQESVLHGVIVYVAAVVAEAVAHDEVIYLQHHVVAGNLVEYGLRDFHMRSLVFHNHAGTEVLVEKHRVAALFRAVEVKLYLVGKQTLGIALIIGQEMHKVLSYPFLRSKCDVFFSERVENETFSVPLLYFNIEGW